MSDLDERILALEIWAWGEERTRPDRLVGILARMGSPATEIATLTERLRVAEEALGRLDEHPDAIGSHPLNKPSTMLRKVRKARRFPDNTCPASRHVQIMAECLIRGEPYDMIESEPVHVGESMLSVVTSLYEARTELAEARTALAAIRGE
jgi:hypothetical protein